MYLQTSTKQQRECVPKCTVKFLQISNILLSVRTLLADMFCIDGEMRITACQALERDLFQEFRVGERIRIGRAVADPLFHRNDVSLEEYRG